MIKVEFICAIGPSIFEKGINDTLKKLQKNYKIIDIKLAAADDLNTALILYEIPE